MNGNEILQSLNVQDLSFSDLAKLLDVSRQMVWLVAHRKSDSARIARALAIALGKTVAEVFPDRPQYTHRSDPEARAKRLQTVRQSLSEAGCRLNPKTARSA